MNEPEHPIADEIIKILKTNNCWFETFSHAPVRTSEEAAALRPGYTMAQGAKAIIVRLKVPNQGKRFAMLVMPGDKRFNLSKLKQLTGAKDIRFASESEVETLTKGVKPGGVPPFGNLFDMEVISDNTLYDEEIIIFNAGRTISLAMKSKDYLNLVKPLQADIID